jgi:hypothetical protein
MASDILCGALDTDLVVSWVEAESKRVAKETQDALISLFTAEFGRQPTYNTKSEQCAYPENRSRLYDELKLLIRRGKTG